jgi:pimeloyl-ACP methyl ester carboxylesterase
LLSLAQALLDTASVTRATPGPVRVAPAVELPPDAMTVLRELVTRMADALRVPRLDVVPGTDGLSAVELAVSRRLRLDRGSLEMDADRLADAAGQALAAFPGRPVVVPSHDGVPLRCWLAGPEGRPAVAIVSACGMPAGLAARWMKALSSSYRVVTWESRGLFAADDGSGLYDLGGHSLADQAGDLLAVLDGLGVAEAHALGLCGGAAITLAAAARSDRITSMSLWHGDYDLGGSAPKTPHQQDVQAMLAMASRGREQAAGLHRLMRHPATADRLRQDIAHYLIHPYATPETLYRYGLLNGMIMTTDCRPFLAVRKPALVISSAADKTAHPAGSEFIARHLPEAELRMLPSGDHLTAFDAGQELVDLASDFLGGIASPDRTDA